MPVKLTKDWWRNESGRPSSLKNKGMGEALDKLEDNRAPRGELLAPYTDAKRAVAGVGAVIQTCIAALKPNDPFQRTLQEMKVELEKVNTLVNRAETDLRKRLVKKFGEVRTLGKKRAETYVTQLKDLAKTKAAVLKALEAAGDDVAEAVARADQQGAVDAGERATKARKDYDALVKKALEIYGALEQDPALTEARTIKAENLGVTLELSRAGYQGLKVEEVRAHDRLWEDTVKLLRTCTDLKNNIEEDARVAADLIEDVEQALSGQARTLADHQSALADHIAWMKDKIRSANTLVQQVESGARHIGELLTRSVGDKAKAVKFLDSAQMKRNETRTRVERLAAAVKNIEDATRRQLRRIPEKTLRSDGLKEPYREIKELLAQTNAARAQGLSSWKNTQARLVELEEAAR